MLIDILKAVKGNAERPTRIMYRSNLSWSACRDMLQYLVGRNFVRVVTEGERKQYELTPRGADVLRSYATAVEELGNYEDP